MPELPEVETIARYLNTSGIIGVPVSRVSVFWERTVGTPAVSRFKRELRGRSIEEVTRRAKFLLFRLDDGRHLCVHLRMTGNFRVTEGSAVGEHDRIALDFENGLRLHYRDTRKFGRWELLDNLSKLDKLGPEPLSDAFSAAWFRDQLKRHKRKIKPLLLDQNFIAGLGNIYVDESLFLARIHPERSAGSLTEKEVRDLRNAIRKVLRQSIRNQGTSLGDGKTNYAFAEGRRGRNQLSLNVYQQTGKPCPVCGNPIEKTTVAQRGTHFCPHCQLKE